MTHSTPTRKPHKKQEAQRLGRGLSSLLGDSPIQTATAVTSQTADDIRNSDKNAGRDIKTLPIEWIVPGPWQQRRNFDSDELKELAVSIKSRGLLQPVIVRPHPLRNTQFQLIAGERRWRASQMAALHEIPAIITGFEDKEAAELSLIENIQRRDLSVIEEAEGYQVLMEKHGYSQQELAEIVGKSRSHIANIGRLLSLSGGIKDKIIKGILTMGQVRPLIGREDAEQLVEFIISDNLSARDVEALIKSKSKPKTASPLQEKSSDIKALEIRARTELGLSMRLDWDEQNDRGQVSVKVTSLEQLESLLAKIGLKQVK